MGIAYKGAKSASPRRSRNHGTEDPNPATRSRVQAWCGLGRASPQFPICVKAKVTLPRLPQRAAAGILCQHAGALCPVDRQTPLGTFLTSSGTSRGNRCSVEFDIKRLRCEEQVKCVDVTAFAGAAVLTFLMPPPLAQLLLLRVGDACRRMQPVSVPKTSGNMCFPWSSATPVRGRATPKGS